MKKIDANYELFKIRSKSNFSDIKTLKNIFITSFLFVFSVVALLGIGFSSKLLFDKQYIISIDIINGYEEKYYNIVSSGYFEDFIFGPNAEVSSIVCSSGNIFYDYENYRIYSDNIDGDIDCTLEFKSYLPIGLNVNYLDTAYDDYGVSYLFSKDSNNYFLYNDMLFRIIRINGDGSIRLMLNDSIGKYSVNNADFVLDEWFNNLNDKVNLVLNSYDDFNLDNFGGSLVHLDEYNIKRVGLISVNELLLYGIDFDNTMLSNKYYDSYWGLKDFNVQVVNENSVFDVRPVINIRAMALEGDGTEELPYKIVK